MTILYNTNYTHNANSYLTIAVHRAAEALFGADNVVLADNRTLGELAAAGEHATLICIDGQRLHRQLLERVRPAFQTMVLWLFEDPFMLEYNLGHTDLFDAVFTNDPSCAGRYPRGHYLPLAASRPLQFRPVRDDAALEYDIFFAGTMWPNRVGTIRRLLAEFPLARLKLVCPTNPFLPPLPRDIASRAIQWPVSHASFVDFANASRVTLTMFRDYASHGDVSQATAPGPRLFELAMAGAAQVVEIDQGVPAANFGVVEGVACCDSLAAVVAETRALLEQPELRRDRAIAAQDCVEQVHRLEHRLQQIAAVTGADFSRKPAASPAAPSRRLRVLMCTHSTMRQPDWGGVEVYQQFLLTALSSQVEVLFWLRRGNACSLEHSDGRVLEQFSAPEIGWLDSLTDATEEMAFANALCQYGIDVVHFQHLGHHTASLPMIAKSCGAGTVWSAHDFFLVCSRYNLLNNNIVFCDIGNRSIAACDICLKIAENVPPGGQQTRRGFIAEMLRSVDVLLFGTAYSEWLTRRIYPGIADKRCHVLGIPTPRETGVAGKSPPAVRAANAPLKVAVVGNFLRSKGADTILSVIENVDPARFQFHLLGKAEAQYEEVLTRAAYPHVAYRGRYEAGDLDGTDGCDVSLHLSIWPETYCISLSETWQRGIVPIVTRIGAFADRVTHGENGFVVNVGDAAAVIGYLELLRADPGTLAAMRGRITPALWVDGDAYAASLLDIYRSVAPRQALGTNALSIDAGQIHLLPHASWRDQAPPRHIFDPSRQSDVRLELPVEITRWIDAAAARTYIDSVAECPMSLVESGEFQPSDVLELTGWTFVPNMGVSGQVYAVLVGDGGRSPIFIKASRHARKDIQLQFPGAPQQAGFSARARLQGKWSDGLYQLATVMVFAGRAAFHITRVSLELLEGRVINVAFRDVSAQGMVESFHQVAERSTVLAFESLERLPLDGVALTVGPLRYVFDDIGSHADVGGSEAVEIVPSRVLHLRGWAICSPPVAEPGELYVGLVGRSRAVFWQTRRLLRRDVSEAFAGSPHRAGFVVDMALPLQTPDGPFQVVVCNVVGQAAVLVITRLVTVFKDGRFDSVHFAEMPTGEREAFLAQLQGQPAQPATSILPPPAPRHAGKPPKTPPRPSPTGALSRRQRVK